MVATSEASAVVKPSIFFVLTSHYTTRPESSGMLEHPLSRDCSSDKKVYSNAASTSNRYATGPEATCTVQVEGIDSNSAPRGAATYNSASAAPPGLAGHGERGSNGFVFSHGFSLNGQRVADYRRHSKLYDRSLRASRSNVDLLRNTNSVADCVEDRDRKHRQRLPEQDVGQYCEPGCRKPAPADRESSSN